MNEKEMREATVPTPHNAKELQKYIDDLVSQDHDYGTCVYAMSMAATAAFNYVASKLGVTGFQASCADLDILRRIRHLDGPFVVLTGENTLYPQYDLRKDLEECLAKWKPWAAEEAEKRLAQYKSAHPNVVAHWKMLAANKETT